MQYKTKALINYLIHLVVLACENLEDRRNLCGKTLRLYNPIYINSAF